MGVMPGSNVGLEAAQRQEGASEARPNPVGRTIPVQLWERLCALHPTSCLIRREVP